MNEAADLPIGRERVGPHRQVRRAVPVFLVLGFAGLLFAACGGASGPGVASIGSTTTTNPSLGSANLSPFAPPARAYQYALSYAVCMQTHGVPNFPDPVKSNRGFGFNPRADSNSPRFAAANSACKHLLPDNGGLPTAAQTAAETAKLLQYAQCMRAHGVPNFPDPIVKPNQFGFNISGVDPNSPQFQSAQKACRSLSPFGGG
jgi:hypothetical protein